MKLAYGSSARDALRMNKIQKSGIFQHLEREIWCPGLPFVGQGYKWMPSPEAVFKVLRELGCRIVDRNDGPDAIMSFYVLRLEV